MTSSTLFGGMNSFNETRISCADTRCFESGLERSLGYQNTETTLSPPLDSSDSSSLASKGWRNQWARYIGRSEKPMSLGGIDKSSVPSSTQAQLEFLGYKQELHRNWDFWALFSLSFCNVTVLQGSFGALGVALSLFGPIMMTVGMFITSCLMICLNSAFAEMASAFPAAGAMFTWTFKLARANPYLSDWARLLSWIVGFLLFTAHLMLQLQIGLEFSKIFTTVFTASGVRWFLAPSAHVGIALAFICICGLISCTTLARSPIVWKAAGVITVALQLSVCVALVATSTGQRTFSSLFAATKTKPMFGNKGWSLLYAWASTTMIAGSEAAPHMAEETKDAAKAVPNAIFFSSLFTAFMQLLCSFCVTLTITPMHHKKPTGVPVIDAIFWHCPKPVALFITISILLTSFLANISQFLATSRFFWSLARDKALPKAKFLRHVTKDHRPLRATLLMIVLSMLVCLFSLEPSGWLIKLAGESSSHFIMVSYLTPLIIYAFSTKGVYDRDGSNVWTLKGISKLVAWVSIAFLTVQFMIHSGPSGTPVSIKTFPMAPFVLIGALAISLSFWFLYGKTHFAGPVKSITTWTVGYEVEIPKNRPHILPLQEKPSTYLCPRTMDLYTTEQRSGVNFTNHSIDKFEVPQVYRTYDSSGSLWSTSDGQDHNQSFFR